MSSLTSKQKYRLKRIQECYPEIHNEEILVSSKDLQKIFECRSDNILIHLRSLSERSSLRYTQVYIDAFGTLREFDDDPPWLFHWWITSHRSRMGKHQIKHFKLFFT